jgi:tetratricopeptide (TPR) repeat protein
MQEHDRRSREAELAKAYAEAKALQAQPPRVPWDADQLTMPIPAEWEDRLCAQLKNILGEWANTMNRREILRLLGWATAIVAASPVGGLDADDQERLTQAIALPSRVDAQVIDSLAATFRQCKRQEDALGSRRVLNMVLAQQRLIHSLVRDCPGPLRPRLLSVYSDMSTSIGYYFFELSDLDSAHYHCEQARVAAHEAGDTGLSIYALCEMSYFASWQGKAPLGIDFATAAESLLPKTDDPLMPVAVAQRAATAYATDGQYEACMNRLEKAQEKLAPAGPVPVESPLYFYNEGYLASHKSECLLRLRKTQEAAASATAGLTLYDKSFADGYAVCTLHLGNAYLQAGEIDEAAQVISRAATLCLQTRSARLVKELRTARNQMEPWRQTRAVKDLDERLMGIGFEV